MSDPEPAAPPPPPGGPLPDGDDPVPASERAFYVDEFAGETLVAAIGEPSSATLEAVQRAARSLAGGRGRLLLVVDADVAGDAEIGGILPAEPVVLEAPEGELDGAWLAELWLAITDRREVVVGAERGEGAMVGARMAVALRARKLVLTDERGGWGRPPRSFADIETHADAFQAQLADRQGGAVVAALQAALDGGVVNVNLCRPEDIDRELFTFDGAGTLFTSGSYVALDRLRVDDLPAVERLVAQGTADGLLRPRTRSEVARLAVGGLGARVVGSGHLAGIVSLDAETYRDHGLGEVACLYTVSRFSGAGAGALLIDGLLDQASSTGLEAVFAVTVSDAAAAFFDRKGFVEVGHDEIPSAKWAGYDPDRLDRARGFVRSVDPPVEQGSLGF
ncbi:GNAT family N-acetyltransferase [Aquihabitans daechungensis]|uniref:GNAT family N-acetyltransferase n=1 Tax=Aquihabitans daechungensis TaxID=1052257 RepID=UPI003B9F9BBF